MTKILSLLKSLITEQDGVSLCPIRVFAVALSVPAVLFFIIGCVLQIKQGHFDIQAMSTAFATLTAGYAALGASVALKMIKETS